MCEAFFVVCEKRKLELGLFMSFICIQIEQIFGILFEVAMAREFVFFQNWHHGFKAMPAGAHYLIVSRNAKLILIKCPSH